jgi:sugar lactone lactonase YvrE
MQIGKRALNSRFGSVRRNLLAAAAMGLVVSACSGGGTTVTTLSSLDSVPSAAASPTTAPLITGTSTSPPSPSTTTREAEGPAAVASYEQVLVVGDGDGVEFLGPNHLAHDADGNLYVTEFGGGRVFVFSPTGELLQQFAGVGDEVGQLSGPTGIAVDAEGFVYVGESGTSRVQKFDPEGNPVALWGQFGVGPGEFGSAMGVGINDQLGRVYVADHVNSRIHVYTIDGDLLFMFPRGGDFTHIGNEPDQMWLPIGVDVAADGTVYVVDSGNQRVQKFTPDGELIAVLSPLPVLAPQVISVEDDGSYWLSGPRDQDIVHFSPTGELLGRLVPPEGGFAGPHGTETASDGTVWVADTGNGVVRAYRVGETAAAPPEADTSSTQSTTSTTGLPPDAEISMISFGYEPPAITVRVGDTVRWVNPTGIQHTATSTGVFDSGSVGQGETFTFTFTTAGTFDYFCAIHGAALQSGTITVES